MKMVENTEMFGSVGAMTNCAFFGHMMPARARSVVVLSPVETVPYFTSMTEMDAEADGDNFPHTWRYSTTK